MGQLMKIRLIDGYYCVIDHAFVIYRGATRQDAEQVIARLQKQEN